MRVPAALCVCLALLGCHRPGGVAVESEPEPEPRLPSGTPVSVPSPHESGPAVVRMPAPADLATRPWIGDAAVHYDRPDGARTVALDAGRIATLDRTGRSLSLSEPGAEQDVWSSSLPTTDAVGPAVVAWSEPGALVVEWRTADGYQRLFIDPDSGASWLRESLDPNVATVVHDPLAFILEAWPPEEPEPVAVADPGSETFAETIVSHPGSYAGVCDLADERSSIAARAVEVRPGIVVVAEATYYERDFGPEVLRDTRPECTGATVIDTRVPGEAGRWSTWRPEP